MDQRIVEVKQDRLDGRHTPSPPFQLGDM
jgi:hypothetical protein